MRGGHAGEPQPGAVTGDRLRPQREICDQDDDERCIAGDDHADRRSAIPREFVAVQPVVEQNHRRQSNGGFLGEKAEQVQDASQDRRNDRGRCWPVRAMTRAACDPKCAEKKEGRQNLGAPDYACHGVRVNGVDGEDGGRRERGHR